MHKQDCDPFLNTGMKFAILKSLGTTPVEREAVAWIYRFLTFLVCQTGMLDGLTDLPDFS